MQVCVLSLYMYRSTNHKDCIIFLMLSQYLRTQTNLVKMLLFNICTSAVNVSHQTPSPKTHKQSYTISCFVMQISIYFVIYYHNNELWPLIIILIGIKTVILFNVQTTTAYQKNMGVRRLSSLWRQRFYDPEFHDIKWAPDDDDT